LPADNTGNAQGHATLEQRQASLNLWLQNVTGQQTFEIKPASGDASFRQYFRVTFSDKSFIAMDAPPDKENNPQFVKVAKMFHAIGLHVPEILEKDLEQGFLLLSDMGNDQYLPKLNDQTVERLYGDALGALASLQALIPGDTDLPPYNHELLIREMKLFSEWYLPKEKNIDLSVEQEKILFDGFQLLAEEALKQPVVCVHRDYHSRNLMICEGHNPGILDFQDAVMGPVTYDLVSLLKDCYISWPREKIEGWVKGFHDLAIQSGILQNKEDEFLRWFDWMGVQRHFKATGIFARLKHRDGKNGYIKDIPRTMGYVIDVCQRYDELKPLHQLLQEVA
jgi:N-acetylmuramate 1-kinase